MKGPAHLASYSGELENIVEGEVKNARRGDRRRFALRKRRDPEGKGSWLGEVVYTEAICAVIYRPFFCRVGRSMHRSYLLVKYLTLHQEITDAPNRPKSYA